MPENGLPPGVYKAQITDSEGWTGVSGSGAVLIWTVIEGPFKGRSIDDWIHTVGSEKALRESKTRLRGMVAAMGLRGSEIKCTEDAENRPATIVVGHGARISRYLALKDYKLAAAASAFLDGCRKAPREDRLPPGVFRFRPGPRP